MKWFLVLSVFTGGGFSGDLIMPTRSVQAELAMPSQAICEQVRDLNQHNAECWAKTEKAPSASTLPSIDLSTGPYNR